MAQAEEPKERGLVEYQSRDGQAIKLSFDVVRRYLVQGRPEFVTDQEIMVFMGTAKARGLNPFKKDCYIVKYTEKDNAATIVSIDYFRSRARAQEDCVGWKAGIIILHEKKDLEYRDGSLMLEGDELVGGWFKARPKGWDVDYMWTISLAPFIKRRSDGAPTAFWRDENQSYMIEKVVESQGLRRVWPDEFQGLYVEEDIQPLDVTPERKPEPLKVPRPLPEKAKVEEEKKDEPIGTHGTESGPPRGADAAGGDIDGTLAPGGREAHGAGPPKSKAELALDQIGKYGKDTFPPFSELRVYTDGMNVNELKLVTTAYENKRKALGL